MFTGLVTDVGRVAEVEDQGALRRIRIETGYPPPSLVLGASIACSGPCLTVVASGPKGEGGWFDVHVSAETMARTTARDWAAGRRINLERSLKVGDELGGHIVTGHVDAVAEIVSREKVSGEDGGERSARFWFRVPRELAGFIAPKGSVSLDGTSLTVNEVEGDRFSVMLIPHTLAVTTWGGAKAGDRVNLEVDLMARYAARLAEARRAGY